MARIDEVQIPSLIFEELAAAPATPAADTRRLFVDTGGILKWVDDAGTVTPIGVDASGQDVDKLVQADGSDGIKFGPGYTVSATEPVAPAEGHFWIDTTGGEAVGKVRLSGAWVTLAGSGDPGGGGGGGGADTWLWPEDPSAITGFTGASGASGGGSRGTRLLTTSAITVSSLRSWPGANDPGEMYLSIWNADTDTKLGGGTVADGVPEAWNLIDLDTPLAIASGVNIELIQVPMTGSTAIARSTAKANFSSDDATYVVGLINGATADVDARPTQENSDSFYGIMDMGYALT